MSENLIRAERQERTQQALREAERRFRAAFNQQFQFMVILALDGTVLEANDTCFRTTGVQRNQVLGRVFWDTPWWNRLPEMQQRWQDILADAIRSPGPVAGEVDYLTADGSLRHTAVVVTGLKDEAQQVKTIIVEGRDDTRRRSAEAALRQSEQRWRTMAEALPNLVWTDLPDGQCDWLSSQWTTYTGVPESELLGLRWIHTVIHPDDRQRTIDCWRAACADQGDYDLEYRIRRHDGEYRWFKTRGVPIRDDTGRIVYWFGTCTDIEDHKRAEEKLKEADRRKDEFLAMLAHELRNPLAPIRSGLEIMRLAAGDPDTVEHARGIVERQVEGLIRLVDDLLDVSRISRGKIELRKETIDLAAVVRIALETCDPIIKQYGHELTVTLPADPVFLNADKTRLAQALCNLLSNAAKYTEQGGRIWLSVEPAAEEVAVRIKDTGIGIPAEMLPSVFEMFTQLDRKLEKTEGGLGIGLTIVKRLVELHGGRIEAHSEGHGKGSEFVIRLPIAAPRAIFGGDAIGADVKHSR